MRLEVDDLMLRLGPTPSRRIGAWLYAGLRAAIIEGDLPPESSLPASRLLATALGVARGTVTTAQDQLVAEGLLRSAPRARLVVTPPAGASPARRPPTSTRAPTSPGTPDPALFPRSVWTRCFREALAELTGEELGYPDPQGLPRLRAALAGHLHVSRGVRADPDSIVVVSGVAQAFSLIARVLGPGARLAMEDPGSAGTIAMFRGWGMRLTAVPVDGDGLVVERIDPRAESVMVTAAHQYPLGVPTAPDRRRELVAWASDSAATGERWIIEDDYDAELRYDREPVPALQCLAPDRTLLAGSVSKTLSPALRLGWLVAPPALVGRLVDGKRADDLGCPVPEQATLAVFLQSGAMGRHTRRARTRYRQRRELLLAALDEHGLGHTARGVAAGLHLAIELDSATAEHAIMQRIQLNAAARGQTVVVQPLSAGSLTSGRFGLVVGTAQMTAGSAELIASAIRSARP